MIIRSVIWKATFYCCYVGNIMTRKPVVFEREQSAEVFYIIPTESLRDWAVRMSRERAEEMGYTSCIELSRDFYACNLEVEVISTEEAVIPTIVIPKFIMDRIETINVFIREAETFDEKKALQDEAVALLRDYVSEEEARIMVPII